VFSNDHGYLNKERKPLRLAGYNYCSAGFYYVTLCTQGRLCLFGEIVDGDMLLNEAGQMIFSVLKNMQHGYILKMFIKVNGNRLKKDYGSVVFMSILFAMKKVI
jgi:hypothetical protein